MPSSKTTEVPIMPVSGFMDTRSTPDEVPFGGYRYVQNIEVAAKKRLCRMRGWVKYNDGPDYGNQDLHDQRVGLSFRESITMIHRATVGTYNKLYAGTRSRLYALSNSEKNWEIIGSGYGGASAAEPCDRIYFNAASVGQFVFFTNDYDPIQYHVVDQDAETDGSKVSTVRDLETLNITKAAVVVSWNNFILLMNVEQDGQRIAHRVVWSDYKRPTSFVPNADISLAGFNDLESGETILNAEPMADVLLIYTNKRIWEVRLTGGAEVFAFAKRYVAEKTGARCLAYPRTLTSDGDNHYYMGEDGIYQYNLFVPRPQLVDYIHRASSLMFDDINTDKCEVHVAGYNPRKRQFWFSWAKSSEDCPKTTLVVGTEFPFTSYVNHGFTAFSNNTQQNGISIAEFLINHCICTVEELAMYGHGIDDMCAPFTNPECPDRPQSFFSSNSLTVDDVIVEDFSQESADSDSFCALYPGLTYGDLCNQIGRCNSDSSFIMASQFDNSLKETADVAYRERALTFTDVCGTYQQDGYKSFLRSGAIAFGVPNSDKLVAEFGAEIHPEDANEAVPGELTMWIGVATQALDPNVIYPGWNQGDCMIAWEKQDPITIKCQDDTHIYNNQAAYVMPDGTVSWPLAAKGKYFYYQLDIENPNANNTGALCCFSRFYFDAKRSGTRKGRR